MFATTKDLSSYGISSQPPMCTNGGEHFVVGDGQSQTWEESPVMSSTRPNQIRQGSQPVSASPQAIQVEHRAAQGAQWVQQFMNEIMHPLEHASIIPYYITSSYLYRIEKCRIRSNYALPYFTARCWDYMASHVK